MSTIDIAVDTSELDEEESRRSRYKRKRKIVSTDYVSAFSIPKFKKHAEEQVNINHEHREKKTLEAYHKEVRKNPSSDVRKTSQSSEKSKAHEQRETSSTNQKTLEDVKEAKHQKIHEKSSDVGKKWKDHEHSRNKISKSDEGKESEGLKSIIDKLLDHYDRSSKSK